MEHCESRIEVDVVNDVVGGHICGIKHESYIVGVLVQHFVDFGFEGAGDDVFGVVEEVGRLFPVDDVKPIAKLLAYLASDA